MKIINTINIVFLILLVLSLLTGAAKGHAETGTLILAILLYVAPIVCAIMMVVLFKKYKAKTVSNISGTLLLTLFTAIAPWLVLWGIFIRTVS